MLFRSGDAAKPEPSDKSDKPSVVIDPQGLPDRIVKLSNDRGGYFRPVYADGDGHVWYQGDGLRMFDLNTGTDTGIASGAVMVAVDPTGSKAVISSGEYYVVVLRASLVLALVFSSVYLRLLVNKSLMRYARNVPLL